MKAILLALAAIAAAAAAVIGFHIAAGDPRTLELASVPEEVEELAQLAGVARRGRPLREHRAPRRGSLLVPRLHRIGG